MPEVVTIAPMGPTGARRPRVPKMRVCDERLGVKRGQATRRPGAGRSATRPFSVRRADEVIE
jgi:hypothetical protein